MKSWCVFPSPPTGNNRCIELSGNDLLLIRRIDRIFVYPSELNIDRFNEALGRALSLWPLVAAHFLLVDGDHYMMEMSDNAVPVSLVENTDLSKWPLNSHVVVDIKDSPLGSLLDEVRNAKLVRGSNEEPLFTVKLTHIVKSGEWVMGISWFHALGDAAACSSFLNTISRLYQGMQPLEPLPVFERRLWEKEEGDLSSLPLMKRLRDAGPVEQMLNRFSTEQASSEQLNMCFSGEQLAKLREMAGGNPKTVQDALTAYIIRTLNTHCFTDDDKLILRVSTVVNYRGVSDEIAPRGLVANSIFVMLSEDFDDPRSMSSIAQTIRRSTTHSRDPKFLKPCLATTGRLFREITRDGKLANMGLYPNEVLVNSELRYDWADLVDFGYTDKCRFHNTEAYPFLRVFRLNPVYDGTQWTGRDRDGAEVVFSIERSIKDKFVSAWQNDINNNFVGLKK